MQLISSLFYVFAQDLTFEDKLTFCRWANLPTGYWGDEHNQEFAIAMLHFFESAKYKGIPLPEKMLAVSRNIPKDEIPALARPLSSEVIKVFSGVFSL